MKINRFRFLVPAIAVLFVTLLGPSCDKEGNTVTNPTGTPPTIDQLKTFLSDNQPEVQSFQFSANSYNEVVGSKGTRIGIPANAFVNLAGFPIIGSFTFQLQEIRSASDMIFSQKMTSSQGRTLASGGEFYINAQQNGKDLRLAPGTELDFKVPTDSFDPQMGLFVGSGTGDNFDWSPAPNTQVSECRDSSSVVVSNYCFQLDTLIKWINCDYFYSDPRPKTEVEIQVPSSYTDQNTVTMVYIPSIQSMTRPQYDNGSFFIRSGYKLPVGLAVTFIGVHHDGNDIYYSVQNAVIVNNHIEVLSFKVVTQAQLVAILNSL